MPWKIVPVNGKYRVVNKDSGKVMGTHDTREQAVKQLSALYANVPEAEEK